MSRLTPFGDRAVRFAIGSDCPRRQLVTDLLALPGVANVALTEELGCVVFEADADVGAVVAAVSRVIEAGEAGRHVPADEPKVPVHRIRIVYDGPDVDAIARAVGRTRAATIALHAEQDYRVAMLGFLPGFAYLGGLSEALRLPRRAPRPRIEPGSVGIAAQYTGIYPYPSAGGWNLVGRAVGFSPFTGGRATLEIGDVVHFVPTAESEAPAPPRASAAPRATPLPFPAPHPGPHLELARVAGVALLVDAGRSGRMHEGVPPGGPLVRSLFARANTLAGNGTASACAVELTGNLEVVARGGRVVIADERGRVELAAGERYVVSSGGRARVSYLAVEGGIEAPLVLGSRGALLVAGVGRLLAKGDCLAPLERADGRSDRALRPVPEAGGDEVTAPVALLPGPDEVPGFALEDLEGRVLTVSSVSNRVGTRLDGFLPPPATGAGAMTLSSAPMVEGAVELTPSGLVVLGPDHPTTGGYPVVAVVRASSRDALFARPLGARVTLVVA